MALLPESSPAPQVVAALRAAGIAADTRGQLLRLSPGVMTGEAGVDDLLAVLARSLRG
jgi:selenocysteine lyase/cysteine desulfurase